MILLADKWKDYRLLDAGDKDKLERWNSVVLVRPDPQAIWSKNDPALWNKYDAVYHRSSKGGGSWEFRKKTLNYYLLTIISLPAASALSLNLSPAPDHP